jgi:hypothetical protein
VCLLGGVADVRHQVAAVCFMMLDLLNSDVSQKIATYDATHFSKSDSKAFRRHDFVQRTTGGFVSGN